MQDGEFASLNFMNTGLGSEDVKKAAENILTEYLQFQLPNRTAALQKLTADDIMCTRHEASVWRVLNAGTFDGMANA